MFSTVRVVLSSLMEWCVFSQITQIYIIAYHCLQHAMISTRDKRTKNHYVKISEHTKKQKTTPATTSLPPPPLYTHTHTFLDLLPGPYPSPVFIWIQSFPRAFFFLPLSKPQSLSCPYQHRTSHSVLKISSISSFDLLSFWLSPITQTPNVLCKILFPIY